MAKPLRKKKSYVQELEASEKVDASAFVASVPQEAETHYRCTCCGRSTKAPSGVFPKTKSPLYASNKYYANVCWKCIIKYYDSLVKFFKGDESRAAERFCQIFDIYYNQEAFDGSRSVNEANPRIRNYMSRLNFDQFREKTSYLDTLVDAQREVILSMDDLERSEAGIEDVNRWGFGFEPSDYAFLNSELEDWAARCTIEGKSQESLVKDVCMLTLQQNKALKDGKFDLYQKITDTRQKTLDRAALTPKAVISKEKENEKPIGVMIEMFEKERPISEPLPEWKDVDGIMKLVLVYFIGHLCKMLGLKNKYARMYEEEMDKYKASIPDIQEASDSEEVFDYLLDNGFAENGVVLGGDTDESDISV